MTSNLVSPTTTTQSISGEANHSIEAERCTKKDPKVSYKEKLAQGKTVSEEEDPWALDEEPECEEGDILVTEDENGPKVKLCAAFKKRLEKSWERAVIVKLLGRTIGYRALHSKIQSMWKPTGPFRLIDMENNFYIIRF
ncbi:hypothetical protein Tsubulata_003593 [Turnera subulata]|uniref:DUF4283 domain-containing protein n=1 Tax=Turnera subulata TaxID=218843 RepID=A0A9Q0JB17_9ROSI|nr:hypothetical protein Tsubulata_003593 [Turnera subulata]